jgi:hypothetical protein
MADVTPSENLPRADVPGAPKDIATSPEKQFDAARGLGQRLLNLTSERRERRLSTFAPRPERFSQDWLTAIGKKEPGDITEEAVTEAKLGSFGLTLEVARQVVSGDVDRDPRAVREDTDNLRGFARTFNEGAKLGQELADENATGFTQTARDVLSRELGKPAGEIEMDDERIKGWVSDTYKKAEGLTAKRLRAVEDIRRF